MKPARSALQLIDQVQDALDFDLDAARECLRHLKALISDHETGILCEHGAAPAPLEPAHPGALAPWQLKRVTAYIDAHLSEPIYISTLAEIAKLSPAHFSRGFKISAGETPHNYLTRRRIERAKMLMLTTADNLSQIACACGLADQAHLTRLFRRQVGQTPSSWRRARYQVT
jgi:AraC family transcriptional regulator